MIHLLVFMYAFSIAQQTSVHLIGGGYECTGVIIPFKSHTAILTAKHCVVRNMNKIEYWDGSTTIATQGYVASHADIGLLVPNAATPLAAAFGDRVGLGEDVLLVGLSQDVPKALSRGFVMGKPMQVMYSKEDKGNILAGQTVTETPLGCIGCDEGDSGAGVFNMQGQLVGVFASMSTDNQRSYMVPLSEVKAFLEAIK